MRYFNYKVKTKMNTPKNYFTAVAVPPVIYTSSVPKGEYQHYLKTLLYKHFHSFSHVKLQTNEQEAETLNIKKLQQFSP